MRLAPVFVPVKRIKTPQIPRSEFPGDTIEKLANAILELQGIVDPIILRRQGSDAYEIVEGVLEYYAAARAREIDLRKGEMVSAFILEGEKEEALKEQVELLRRSHSVNPISIPESIPIVDKKEEQTSNPQVVVTSDHPNFESQFSDFRTRLTQLESHLLSYHTRMTQSESSFEKRLAELEQYNKENFITIENRLQALESNQSELRFEKQSAEPKQQPKLPQELKAEPNTPSSLSPVDLLNTLDSEKLKFLLKGIRNITNIVNHLVEVRENNKFKSLADFKNRVEGVGDKTAFEICDRLLLK